MFHKNKKAVAKKLKGFLIAEVLIASFLLTVGLVAIMGVISSSLRYSLDSQDTIIAVELAQEGVELVRNVRDNDLATGGSGFPASSFDSAKKNCSIAYNDSSVNCSTSLSASYTLQYTTDGFYKQSGGAASKFSRYIYMRYTGGTSPNVLARSFVYWGGGASGTFVATDPGSTGDTTECTIAKKCVFTEIILTAWK